MRHQAAALRLGWPALVVHGTADRVLPTAHAHAFCNGLPRSTLHLVDGMGHLPTRTEWNHLADLSGDFIDEGGADAVA